jgi:hypothetical protein
MKINLKYKDICAVFWWKIDYHLTHCHEFSINQMIIRININFEILFNFRFKTSLNEMNQKEISWLWKLNLLMH